MLRCVLEDRALLCPGRCRNRQVLAEAPGKTAGRETLREPEGPRRAGFLGGKLRQVKPRAPASRAAAHPARGPGGPECHRRL